MGIYTLSGRVDPTKTDLSKFAWPAESAGFEGYLSDSLTIRKELPPVSFSENYIDFGRVLPNDYNEKCKSANCLTLVTCLTNHLETEVFVSWERGKYSTGDEFIIMRCIIAFLMAILPRSIFFL